MFKSIARCVSILSLLTASIASAETVTVRSGNGTIGGRDSSVHFLLGPQTGPFGHQFASADFSSAQTGPAAFIVAPNANWIAGVSADPSAQWIGTNANASCCLGNTALYAVSVPITKNFVSATLTLYNAADNGVGDYENLGVYLNGTPVCGNAFANGPDIVRIASCNNIGPLLHVGNNWL